jgi:hypothetical protein
VWDELKFGAVIFYKDFPFGDGGKSDKLIVVLGVREGCALIVLTTSKPSTPEINPGCSAKRSLFRAQKLARDCLDRDTYFLLHRMGELLPHHVSSNEWKTNAKLIGVLSEQTAHAIKNCAAQTDDIASRHKVLLGPNPSSQKRPFC